MSIESDVMVNAYVLAQIHDLEAHRAAAVEVGDFQLAKRYTREIESRLAAYDKMQQERKHQEALELEAKKRQAELAKAQEKKKGFFARLFDL